jgi:hypothetical protein
MVCHIRRFVHTALYTESPRRPEHQQCTQSPSGRVVEESASIQKVFARKVRKRSQAEQIERKTNPSSLISILILWHPVKKSLYIFCNF